MEEIHPLLDSYNIIYKNRWYFKFITPQSRKISLKALKHHVDIQQPNNTIQTLENH